MRFEPKLRRTGKEFLAIDSHTMGEPTRIILSGFPELEGATMMERKRFLETRYDEYRTALLLEPRGHRDMFGALLTDPVSPEADLGVIFMESGGYLNMCGHGSIGAATVAVEAGLVPAVEPYTTVVLEAPAGLIRASVKVSGGRAEEVSILNVPSFVYRENLEITLPDYGVVPVDISFGGSFFALVDSERVGLRIAPDNLSRLIDFGMRLLSKINATVSVRHPFLDITTVDLVEIYGKPTNPAADLKNVVVFGEAQADRSPCGTGTSAKLAYLYNAGKLGLGEEFVYESITGSLFRGEATQELLVDGRRAIIPKITGSAYVTGVNRLIVDEADPLAWGFLMGKEKEKKRRSPRSRVVAAAWKLFREKGYRETTLSEILSASGVSEPEFSAHFAGLDDLLHTLSDVFDERYAELALEMDPGLSAYEKLVLLNRELFALIEEKIPMDILGHLYSSQMIASGDRHLLDRNRLYYSLVGQIISDGQKNGDIASERSVEELVSAYALLERGLLYDWCVGQRRESLTQTGNALMPSFLSGLLLPRTVSVAT